MARLRNANFEYMLIIAIMAWQVNLFLLPSDQIMQTCHNHNHLRIKKNQSSIHNLWVSEMLKIQIFFHNEVSKVVRTGRWSHVEINLPFSSPYRRKIKSKFYNLPFLLHGIFSRHPRTSPDAGKLKCIQFETTYTAFHLDFPWQMFLPEKEAFRNIGSKQ